MQILLKHFFNKQRKDKLYLYLLNEENHVASTVCVESEHNIKLENVACPDVALKADRFSLWFSFSHLYLLSLCVSRRGAACPVELLLVSMLGVRASWQASYVSWRPATLPQCSAGSPLWSCRAAILLSPHVFAFSGPIKRLADVLVQVRPWSHLILDNK